MTVWIVFKDDHREGHGIFRGVFSTSTLAHWYISTLPNGTDFWVESHEVDEEAS